jgi:pyruvate,orthophosphate dikinase
VDELVVLADALEDAITDVGPPLPTDAASQVLEAVHAAHRAYGSHGARYLRKRSGVPEESGVAVTVQTMVFGSWDGSGVSGSGVARTRDPETGAKACSGVFSVGATGEVAAGSTPLATLRELDAALFSALLDAGAALERSTKDAAEIEFTVEDGALYVLETRPLPRSPAASVQIAVDLVSEGTITIPDALRRVEPAQLETLLRPVVRPGSHRRVVCKGLEASPGAATGRVVFDPEDAVSWNERNIPTVLVRVSTSQEGIQGMAAAVAVVTARGGHTSHAAVAARQMGKPCVVGCSDIQIDYSRELFYAGDSVVRKGDWLTVDGSSGEVLEGQVETSSPRVDTGALNTLLRWADSVARLKVRVNADNGADARKGREFGAAGVGLCRTEHMFFQPEALRAVRRMILANDARARQRALSELLPVQRRMFTDLFRAMAGEPVTIRLLDPPLQEFLPVRDEDISAVSQDLGVRTELLQARMEQLAEANPLLGHRGVRVGLTDPEVYRTQVRAIFEAACALQAEGVAVHPEVMIPLVSMTSEIERARAEVVEVAEAVMAEFRVRVTYAVGTMIEVPRACLIAADLAACADFFSFGTNDLTQATYGMSRDDMGRYFPHYQREGLIDGSPLVVFDEVAVGELVRLAVTRGKAANPRLQLGVCGEHGGDPRAVAWFHAAGVDYVSTSPFRVPVARLAAALAALGS